MTTKRTGDSLARSLAAVVLIVGSLAACGGTSDDGSDVQGSPAPTPLSPASPSAAPSPTSTVPAADDLFACSLTAQLAQAVAAEPDKVEGLVGELRGVQPGIVDATLKSAVQRFLDGYASQDGAATDAGLKATFDACSQLAS